MKRIGLGVTGSFCTFSNLQLQHGKTGHTLLQSGGFLRKSDRKDGQTPHNEHSGRRTRGHFDGAGAHACRPVHGQHACENRARDNGHSRHDGGQSTASQQPSRGACNLVQRRPGRKRQEPRAAHEHPQCLFRPLHAGRSDKKEQLSHCRHDADTRGVRRGARRQTTATRDILKHISCFDRAQLNRK